MDNLNQTDVDIRLQLLGRAIGDFGEKVARQLMYGQRDANKNLKKLKLGLCQLDVLRDYQIIGKVIYDNTIEDGDNCITEEVAQSLFQTLSIEFNVCFPAIGTTFREGIPGDYSDDYSDDYYT